MGPKCACGHAGDQHTGAPPHPCRLCGCQGFVDKGEAVADPSGRSSAAPNRRIVLDLNQASKGLVQIDDVDISRYVAAVHVDLRVDKTPKVHLELAGIGVFAALDDAAVVPLLADMIANGEAVLPKETS